MLHLTVSLTWALIELAMNPDKQDRLRAELDSLGGKDPTYEQLQNELLYLDAVFRETLRIHAPVAMKIRVVGFCSLLLPLHIIFFPQICLISSIFTRYIVISDFFLSLSFFFHPFHFFLDERMVSVPYT
jgi:Cytochrome P450